MGASRLLSLALVSRRASETALVDDGSSLEIWGDVSGGLCMGDGWNLRL